MTTTAQSIYDEAPLGAHIRFTDGTSRPPERFKRKLSAWKDRNSSGQLTQRSSAGTGVFPCPATFTLHEGDYGSGGIVILSVSRVFAVTDQRGFEVTRVPPPGAALVVQAWDDHRELLHVAVDHTAAEAWLEQHGYHRAHVEIVGEAEIATKAA
jgi:hypothetical protein